MKKKHLTHLQTNQIILSNMSRIETRQQVIRIERLENIWEFYNNFQPNISCEGEIANHLNACLSLQSNSGQAENNLFNKAEINGPVKEMIDSYSRINSVCNSAKEQFNEIKNHLNKNFAEKFNEKDISK